MPNTAPMQAKQGLRPPYKDAQEFDYRLSRILRADFDYKDIFSAKMCIRDRPRYRSMAATARCATARYRWRLSRMRVSGAGRRPTVSYTHL